MILSPIFIFGIMYLILFDPMNNNKNLTDKEGRDIVLVSDLLCRVLF